MRTIAGLTTVVFVALVASVAHAQSGKRVLVVPAEGQVPKPLQDSPAEVTAALVKVLESRGAKVEKSASSRADLLVLAGCEEAAPECLSPVAKTLDVDIVVLMTIARADTGVFIDIDVVDRANPEPIRDSWVIDGKTTPEIVAEVTRRVPGLFGSKTTEPSSTTTTTTTEQTAPVADTEVPPGRVPGDNEPPPGFVVKPTPSTGNETDESQSALSRVRWYSWATVGGGLALVGLGTVFMVEANNKQSEIDLADPLTRDDFTALEELEDDAASDALLGNVLLGTGIAAAGVGATLMILQMRSAPGDDVVSISPIVVEGGLGIAFTAVADL